MAMTPIYGVNLVQRTMRWHPDQLAEVEALAELAGKSRNEMVRELIAIALEEVKKEKTL